MTVESQTTRKKYAGTSTPATDYPVTFTFTDESDLEVIFTDSSGTDTTLVLNTDYTVSGGAGSTGTVSVTDEDYRAGTGEYLTIRLNMPIEQQTDLVDGAALSASAIENQFDRNVRVMQQLQEQIDRSVKVTATSDSSPDDIVDELTAAAASASSSASDALVAKDAAEAAQGAAEDAQAVCEGTLDELTTSQTIRVTPPTHTPTSVSAWANSLFRIGGDFDQGDAAQAALFISGQVLPGYSGSVQHQLDGLHVRVTDWHTNAGGTEEGLVAVHPHAIIQTSVTNSRIWGSNPYIQILGDGQAIGEEIDVDNQGSDVSDLTNAYRKIGLMVVSKPESTANITGGVHIAKAGTYGFNNGYSISANSIASGGNAIHFSGFAKMDDTGKLVIGSDTIDGELRVANTGERTSMNMDRNEIVSAATGITEINNRAKNSAGELITFAGISANAVTPTDGAEDGTLYLSTIRNGVYTNRMRLDDGVQVGVPTGGDKGAGTLNAVAVYDDNVLLTCYIVEQWLDGKIDLDAWDAVVPDRIDGDGNVVEERIHKAAHGFATVGADRLDIDKYVGYIRENRRLPNFPGKEYWTDLYGGNIPMGDLVQRLWEAVEVQAVHIAKLNDRLKELEK